MALLVRFCSITPLFSLLKSHNSRVYNVNINVNVCSPLVSLSIKPLQITNCSSSISTLEEAVIIEEDETRLVVQNIPWSADADDIRKLFEQHGTVVHVLPLMHNRRRNKGLAFVTMASPEEATAAIQNLQSCEFEGRVLNVSYARPQKKKSHPSDPQPKTASVYNLFVANLASEVRSQDLRKFFEGGKWEVYTAEIIIQEDTGKSAGYGFVSFNSKEDADAALSDFQGKLLMGKLIRLARSKKFSRYELKSSGPEDSSTELNSKETGNVEEV